MLLRKRKLGAIASSGSAGSAAASSSSCETKEPAAKRQRPDPSFGAGSSSSQAPAMNRSGDEVKRETKATVAYLDYSAGLPKEYYAYHASRERSGIPYVGTQSHRDIVGALEKRDAGKLATLLRQADSPSSAGTGLMMIGGGRDWLYYLGKWIVDHEAWDMYEVIKAHMQTSLQPYEVLFSGQKLTIIATKLIQRVLFVSVFCEASVNKIEKFLNYLVKKDETLNVKEIFSNDLLLFHHDYNFETYIEKINWLIARQYIEPGIRLVETMMHYYSDTITPAKKQEILEYAAKLTSATPEEKTDFVRRHLNTPSKIHFLCSAEFKWTTITTLNEAAEFLHFERYQELATAQESKELTALTPEKNPLKIILNKPWVHDTELIIRIINYIVLNQPNVMKCAIKKPQTIVQLYTFLLKKPEKESAIYIERVEGILKEEKVEFAANDVAQAEWIPFFMATQDNLDARDSFIAMKLRSFLKFVKTPSSLAQYAFHLPHSALKHQLSPQDHSKQKKAIRILLSIFKEFNADLTSLIKPLIENQEMLLGRWAFPDFLSAIRENRDEKDSPVRLVAPKLMHFVFYQFFDFRKMLQELEIFSEIKADEVNDFYKNNTVISHEIPDIKTRKQLPLVRNAEEKQVFTLAHSAVLGFCHDYLSHYNQPEAIDRLIDALLFLHDKTVDFRAVMKFSHDGQTYSGNIFDFVATKFILNVNLFVELRLKIIENATLSSYMTAAEQSARVRMALSGRTREEAQHRFYGDPGRQAHDDEQSTHTAHANREIVLVAKRLRDHYLPEDKEGKSEREEKITSALAKATLTLENRFLAEYKAALQKQARLSPSEIDTECKKTKNDLAASSIKPAGHLATNLRSYVTLQAFYTHLAFRFKEEGSGIFLRELIALAWMAFNDRTLCTDNAEDAINFFCEDIYLKRIEQKKRYETNLESKPVCPRGTFDSYADMLENHHPMGKKNLISAQNLHEYVCSMYDEKFRALPEEKQIALIEEIISGLNEDHIRDTIDTAKEAEIVRLTSDGLIKFLDEVSATFVLVLDEYFDDFANFKSPNKDLFMKLKEDFLNNLQDLFDVFIEELKRDVFLLTALEITDKTRALYAKTNALFEGFFEKAMCTRPIEDGLIGILRVIGSRVLQQLPPDFKDLEKKLLTVLDMSIMHTPLSLPKHFIDRHKEEFFAKRADDVNSGRITQADLDVTFSEELFPATSYFDFMKEFGNKHYAHKQKALWQSDAYRASAAKVEEELGLGGTSSSVGMFKPTSSNGFLTLMDESTEEKKGEPAPQRSVSGSQAVLFPAATASTAVPMDTEIPAELLLACHWPSGSQNGSQEDQQNGFWFS